MKAAVLTLSDKCAGGQRIDTSGPALCQMLEEAGWEVVHQAILSDEPEALKTALIQLSDQGIPLILTTGGTGFSPRDRAPETTLEVVERRVPGIPEAMRMESLKITPRAMLSRGEAGIRKNTLIINLPGSAKASTENLAVILPALDHGLEILTQSSADCAPKAKVVAVCISEKKGEIKIPVDRIDLQVDHGVVGDAHAGNWHRQVSLLGRESVKKLESQIGRSLDPGVFAENILTEGLILYVLPIGTQLKVGTALMEVTQIGKECHAGCAIRTLTGDCVMPREGIFAKVIQAGQVKPGDEVLVL